MKVLVLGCGPAGLMAAHAFAIHNHDVLVFSKRRKSEMYGAQYLHKPIPGMTDTVSRAVTYRLDGTVDGYRDKVYGPTSRVAVSPEDLVGEHEAWDIRRTYDNLWDTYGEYVQDWEATPRTMANLLNDLCPDLTVSTVPAPALCFNEEHAFKSEKVWAIGDAPERGLFCPIVVPKDTVVCNGQPAPAWYRAANVFNRKTAEWPERFKPPISNVASVEKPIRTTCTCWKEQGVLRLGRFGKWEKGVLTHHAFTEALELSERGAVQGSLF